MKIYYHLGNFISHFLAGQEYIHALEAMGHTIVPRPEYADLVIVHDEPIFHPPKMRGKPYIGYCVVETDPMPKAYIKPLRQMDEIWTCSEFSRQILSKEFDNVHCIPHIVRRNKVSPTDIQKVQSLIQQQVNFQEKPYLFYTICDGVNPRKNLMALLRAFALLARRGNYKLVVKQYRQALDLSELPNVISITDQLTNGEIAALHTLCDCYVSAHCAEAWGLSLAQAMAFAHPVVATGYSGNMEFMNENNAFLAKYQKEKIRETDLKHCPPFFSADMHWAYVDETDLALQMQKAVKAPTHIFQNISSYLTHKYSEIEIGKGMNERLLALDSRLSKKVA